jgi:hypothetical protein
MAEVSSGLGRRAAHTPNRATKADLPQKITQNTKENEVQTPIFAIFAHAQEAAQ